ncbi:MAG: chromate transporter [Prevotellaceae bacterium]|nr:chromate transporter [Prevotellaceae bacterium]
MIYLLTQLFLTFFVIGLFGFGGGYAMISLIQQKVVTAHAWMTMGQFTDIVAISQMTPGPIGINSATYVGYTSLVNAGYAHWAGVLGSFVATFAVVLPSFILMLVISRFLMRYKSHPAIENVFRGLRPAVVGLLLAASLCLMTGENFGTWKESPWQVLISIAICLFAFLSQRVYKLNPIFIIFLSAIIGIILL